MDILINNSGVTWGAPLETFPYHAWAKVFGVNVTAVFHLTRQLLPLLEAAASDADPARVINLGSVMGTQPLADDAYSYAASKAAVIALTKSLGKELADKDIAVNCITPAAARTRIFDQMSEEHIGYMLAKIPRGRFLLPEEVASMVAFLASAENSFTTAGVFDLSGGRATY